MEERNEVMENLETMAEEEVKIYDMPAETENSGNGTLVGVVAGAAITVGVIGVVKAVKATKSWLTNRKAKKTLKKKTEENAGSENFDEEVNFEEEKKEPEEK